MITLSERLQLELRNRDPCEITELILDNSKANEIEGLDSSYINLRELSLVNVGLTTLKGFPSLPNLEKLDLSDNKISTGLENLTKCSKLSQLLLTNNRIKNVKDIECLASFRQLEILDLFNCTVSSEENYRKEIFAIVPTLKYLDGFDEKNEEELNESEDYDEEEEVEQSNIKDVYELSDGSESDEEDDDEEYETEEGDLINTNRTSGKAPNTGGKDMNLYPNEVVEISDEEELEENVDEYDEDEDYDEKAEEIIETNGKSKVNNTYMTESDDNDDDEEENENDEEEEDEDEEDDEDIDNDLMDETSLNGNQISLANGIDKNDEDSLPKSLKRKYDTVLNDCYDEDESCDIKSLRNNSDFELTDESSLLDKV